jgi:hypothetical protein
MYNRFRAIEEKHKFDLELQQRTAQVPPAQRQRLRPPTPGGSTAMSRSNSIGSAASITRAFENIDITQSPDEVRRRPGRRGPLDEVKKLQTAFNRKLSVCGSCHTRKVRRRAIFDHGLYTSVPTWTPTFLRLHIKPQDAPDRRIGAGPATQARIWHRLRPRSDHSRQWTNPTCCSVLAPQCRRQRAKL